MDLISSLILLVIVIVPIVLFVTWPLAHLRRLKVEDSQELSTLLAERDRDLNALKELDFDNSLGKIPADEYPLQRANLVQHGAEILRKIDQLAPVSSNVPVFPPQAGDQVEAILSVRRASRSVGSVTVEEEAEDLLARRRKIRAGKSGNFCARCGTPLIPSDRFCPGCGQPV
jgi:hypothetical protein